SLYFAWDNLFFVSGTRATPVSALFPYTTLFRSTVVPGWLGCPVVGLELGGRDEPGLAVKPSVVVPVDVFGGSDFDVADVLPAALGPHDRVADALGLEQRVERLGHGVVVAVALRSDGCDSLGFGEPLGVANRSILTGFNRSLQHRVVGVSVAARRTPRRECASRGSCGACCSARERLLRGPQLTTVTGPCPSGSTAVGARSCSRS